MDNHLIDIYCKGKYYNPASSHYDLDQEIYVTCNNCKKPNLQECIGYENYDLCMECIDNIRESINERSNNLNKYSDKETLITIMHQDIFNTSSNMCKCCIIL